MREGPGYFLFEFWRPFKHVTCVPRARPQQGQHASPAGRSHRRPRRRQGGKGWQGRRQGRWQGLWPCGAPDPLCAAALNARYSVEPAERRRQSCGRRRPHTASSAVETAPRAAARCATTAVARLVAMDAPDPLAPPPSTPDTRSEPAERRRQSCGRWRPHTASSAVETAPRAAARCATTAVARLVAMDAPDPLAPPPSTPDTRSEPAERRRRSCGRRRPSPRPRRRPVDKHVRTAIEKKEKERGASGARGRGVGGRGRGRRARGNPASGGDTMPLAALQAARGAPLAGLPHAPDGREGREAGMVTRGHGRCGPRRARARGSP